VNQIIAPKIIGLDISNQKQIDEIMLNLDGTPNKSKLGANAILSVSLACARAAAASKQIPLYEYLSGSESEERRHVLPVPMMNVINGGEHAGNDLSIQEFFIIPAGADSFHNALRMGAEIYHDLKKILEQKYGVNATNVGDEGGYAPPMKGTREALDSLLNAVEKSGYKVGSDVYLGLDAASSTFFDSNDGSYTLDGKKMSKDDLLDYYVELTEDYPLKLLEDPFDENDFESFAQITKKIGREVVIVGDDLFVTNIERLKRGVSMGAANCLLMKVNQIGSLTEAIDATKYAIKSNYKVEVSHRSGETEDSIIADLAVALNTGLMKTGAPARGERTAKFNQLLRIEEELGEKAIYPGTNVFYHED
jgi:enolase